MKKIILLIGIIGLLLINGCNSPGLDHEGCYKTHLDTCYENNVDQFKYCQCWSSCECGGKGAGTNCHTECDRDWNDD